MCQKRWCDPYCPWVSTHVISLSHCLLCEPTPKYPGKKPLPPKVVSMEKQRRQWRSPQELHCRKYLGVVLSLLSFWDMDTILFFKYIAWTQCFSWDGELHCCVQLCPIPFLNNSKMACYSLLQHSWCLSSVIKYTPWKSCSQKEVLHCS